MLLGSPPDMVHGIPLHRVYAHNLRLCFLFCITISHIRKCGMKTLYPIMPKKSRVFCCTIIIYYAAPMNLHRKRTAGFRAALRRSRNRFSAGVRPICRRLSAENFLTGQEFLKLLRRYGLAEIVALIVVAAKLLQYIKLLFRFDSLGDYFYLKLSCEVDNPLDNLAAV